MGQSLVERRPRLRRLDGDGWHEQDLAASLLEKGGEALRLLAGPRDQDDPARERPGALHLGAHPRGSSAARRSGPAPRARSSSASSRPRASADSTGPLTDARRMVAPSRLATSPLIFSVPSWSRQCPATGVWQPAPRAARKLRSASASILVRVSYRRLS